MNIKEIGGEEIEIPECFNKVAELAIKLGATPMNKHPGCWKYDVDDQWSITLNGHDTEIDSLPPFYLAVYYNGWPAGIVSPTHGGVIAAGTSANENAFIEALDRAIGAAGDKPVPYGLEG